MNDFLKNPMQQMRMLALLAAAGVLIAGYGWMSSQEGWEREWEWGRSFASLHQASANAQGSLSDLMVSGGDGGVARKTASDMGAGVEGLCALAAGAGVQKWISAAQKTKGGWVPVERDLLHLDGEKDVLLRWRESEASWQKASVELSQGLVGALQQSASMTPDLRDAFLSMAEDAQRPGTEEGWGVFRSQPSASGQEAAIRQQVIRRWMGFAAKQKSLIGNPGMASPEMEAALPGLLAATQRWLQAASLLDQSIGKAVGVKSDIEITLADMSKWGRIMEQAEEAGSAPATAVQHTGRWVKMGFGMVVVSLFAMFLVFRRQYAETGRMRRSLRRYAKIGKVLLGVESEMKKFHSGSVDMTHRLSTEHPVGLGVNRLLDHFSGLVGKVGGHARKMEEAASRASRSNHRVLEWVQSQRDSLTSAMSALQGVSSSMVDTAERSGRAQALAASSLKTSQEGGEVVRDTILHMNGIRDAIQDTSKRIKRLSESSQGIGEVTDLIRGIARQVQVLSVNAAIEAANAGPAGRNFAVVAEEIQRLANSSNRAAKKIDELVVAIQEDAQGAVSAMEVSTAEVVDGAMLADRAGLALKEIEQVSHHLADEVVQVADIIEAQAGSATSVLVQIDAIQSNSRVGLDEIENTVRSVDEVSAISGSLKVLAGDMDSEEG